MGKTLDYNLSDSTANLISVKGQLVADQKELLGLAKKEGRDFNETEENHFDALQDRIEAINAELEYREMNGLDTGAGPSKSKPQYGSHEKKGPQATKKYKEAFWNAFRRGSDALDDSQARLLNQTKGLAIGTGTGSYVVPDEFERRIVKKLEENNVMRTLAKVIQTSSGSRDIPIVADGGEAQWLGETEQYSESDITFDRTSLSAHKMGRIMKVTEELLHDSAVDLDELVSDYFGRSFGQLEEAAFINGNGTGKPKGVLLDATLGTVGSQTNSIQTADELLDLYHALKRPYRSGAVWLMNDQTLKDVRKLKTGDGQYLWQPGLTLGEPDRLLGRPVIVSDNMPTMEAGNKSILFGDFSYYWIADRERRSMQRLVEKYAENGLVGFRMYQRVDGKLILPEAIVYFQNAGA